MDEQVAGATSGNQVPVLKKNYTVKPNARPSGGTQVPVTIKKKPAK